MIHVMVFDKKTGKARKAVRTQLFSGNIIVLDGERRRVKWNARTFTYWIEA